MTVEAHNLGPTGGTHPGEWQALRFLMGAVVGLGMLLWIGGSLWLERLRENPVLVGGITAGGGVALLVFGTLYAVNEARRKARWRSVQAEDDQREQVRAFRRS